MGSKVRVLGEGTVLREQGKRLRGKKQEQLRAGEEMSRGQWSCRNMRLGNATGVSDPLYGFVLAHSLWSVFFPKPFPSFSKVRLKVVVQLYDKEAACSWCPHSSHCSFTDAASSPPSVQCCRSGSLGHLLFWCLLPSCTSEQVCLDF